MIYLIFNFYVVIIINNKFIGNIKPNLNSLKIIKNYL